MPNIKSTTPENWVDLIEVDKKPSRPICHFALMQTGVSLDFHLSQFYHGREVSFHYFNTFETLITLCQRFPVNAIIIGGKSDFLREIEILHAIKSNIFMSIIPVILYHPEPSTSVMIAAYENGVEDFIHGEWLDKLVEVRIRRAIDRSSRDISVNPSTHLPGPAIIEKEINRQLDMGMEFAAGYVDLDNFKAFNDYYGYAEGDKIIKLTARIIRDVVFDFCREGFVGHIAGDDYLFVIPRDKINLVCSWIIRTFDSIIPYHYDEQDREIGYITTINRKGEVEDFPILTMSIAVAINEDGKFKHIGEMSKMMADLKKATKQRLGSNYMIERREKY